MFTLTNGNGITVEAETPAKAARKLAKEEKRVAEARELAYDRAYAALGRGITHLPDWARTASTIRDRRMNADSEPGHPWRIDGRMGESNGVARIYGARITAILGRSDGADCFVRTWSEYTHEETWSAVGCADGEAAFVSVPDDYAARLRARLDEVGAPTLTEVLAA